MICKAASVVWSFSTSSTDSRDKQVASKKDHTPADSNATAGGAMVPQISP